MTFYDIPVLYLMFNRPDHVKQTFPIIKKQKPKYLFIASDGPRDSVENEAAMVFECRDWVLSQIDWNCELHTLFREFNLGCGTAVGGAISWFFKNVEMGIILEDDILVDKSFFSFQKKLLNLYVDRKEVLQISGSNFLLGKSYIKADYYYSKFPNTWGWGTWSDRWLLWQQEIDIEETIISDFALQYHNEKVQRLWILRMNALKNGTVDAWDYQWFFQLVVNDMVTVVPSKNLVINIGIGENATHTFTFPGKYQRAKLERINGDVRAPSSFEYCREADILHFNNTFSESTSYKALKLMKKLIPSQLVWLVKRSLGKLR